MLRLLVRNSTDMLSRHAPDGTYLSVSPASRELLGYDPEDLLGRSAYDLFHPEDLETIASSHDDVIDAPQLSTVEYRIRHKRGHWVWFETTSHTVRDPESGEVLEIHTSSRDISERKQADARLNESEQRFRLAMANAPIGMALVGLDGAWLAVNDRLCQLVGRTEDELRRSTFQDITHPDDLDTDLAQMQQLFAGEIDHYTMEKRYLHADGHVVFSLLSASFVRGADGAPIYGIAQIQDISERRRREDQLRRANERLAASNAELERFAAVVSHDLRSPLATVRSFLDLVVAQHGDDLPGEAATFIERARHNADRLLDTVDALLELARIGHEPLATAPVDLAEVVGEVIDAIGPQLDDADAQVDLEPLPTVAADRAQLRLVFQNLLTNAVRFRDPQRRLTISISATEHDGRCEVHVEDNGVGFDAGDADTVFEPFARPTSRDERSGTGLGLATCRRIIERHGGSIRADAREAGARITFTLPTDQRDDRT